MASNSLFSDRPRILVVGGGYVGLYVARNLQKKVKSHGGIVTLVDPLPYMTYQPFLPEVAAGSIEARHAIVSHRVHLPQTELISGRVTSVDHAARTATIEPAGEGEPFTLGYTDIVMAAGAITRTFPIEGLKDQGIGLKTIEEAVALRNQILERIETGSLMPAGPARDRMLTFVVVGGGFAGIEAITEMEDMARDAVKKNARLKRSDVRFVLIEAMPRVMPEVTEQQAVWVVEHLRSRGIQVLLNTSLASAVEGNLKLINMPDKTPADEFATDTLIWTAGVQANPVVRSTDFPVDDRGRLRANAELRITGDDGPLQHAWTAGDVAAVPDLSGGGVGGFCVPNAQHAVRQAKRLAKNIYAQNYGVGRVQEYKHTNLGAVAGFGTFKGVANIMGFGMRGFPAWLAHRGYHGMAMPMFERKARVISNWSMSFIFGRDLAPIADLQTPRRQFRNAATPPPKKDTALQSAPPAPAGKASGKAASNA
ncbi:FAD-dependent oxidoreductase [Arthrobacter sp. MSA 4-2]|uniref:NAD(P)/FAD-dependent oxidoreductase n=1 Tax=Arthrobacter sp. MSA 4-2 TaxID=2794349 RepID=UPI0018E78C41|nr:FAD-dependent oxidoreductase [Arthrobacter sp. MSA 4-2]MBJ2119608.1 FAD-dependent oxidoreductase [Arthrobacter sp. MSA 4-2]